MIKTIYVVTPCINATDTIDGTITSVVSQAGDFRLRYHVQDGGSTDGTLARLEAWTQRLRSGNFPRQCHGIHLTYASEKDQGMYDALVKGFARLNALPDDFMTWINADDILMPGALALASALGRQFTKEQLSWFGGAACTIRHDLVTTFHDRPIPRQAIALGLCDGEHWDYVQQEGTFFRNWLWHAVNPAAISTMKLAGDWNLWRLMAAKAEFAQAFYPLGGFRISENQMSSNQRDSYVQEIDSILGKDARRASMEKMCRHSLAARRRIKAKHFRTTVFQIYEESIDALVRKRYYRVFRRHPFLATREQPSEKLICEGREVTLSTLDSKVSDKTTPCVPTTPNACVIAFDDDWQFPAITEKHAFTRLSVAFSACPPGILYVAYPWATLFDKLQTNAPDAHLYVSQFERFCELLPKNIRKVTVCQHIHGRRYQELFRKAGISQVFWAHATKDDVVRSGTDREGPHFHPFPLYPVQVAQALPEAAPEADATPRRYLFSFIGARGNKHYLTEARTWIVDLLAEDSRGLVVGRESWHYEKIVYGHQIKSTAEHAAPEKLVDTSAADQFLESLKQSTFSLCPSGSGPNSIRLWESIGAGAIPVILADTWAPPGDARLWEMAAVFCKERPNEIRALPNRLAKIAADPEQLASMRRAMRQLWLLYGPQSFVTDVQELMLSHAEVPLNNIDTHDKGEPTWSVIDAALNAKNGESLLRHCASALLLDPVGALERIETDTRVMKGLDKARKDHPPGSDLLRHYDAVLTLARRKVQRSSPVAPSVIRNSVPKICLFGRHANRTPLSYEPIRRLIGRRLKFVESPMQADILISGFNIDLRDNIEALLPALRRPNKPKFAILSEEPLWDITWSGPFTGRDARISSKGSEIAYTFLGHETSDIYEFDRIPYFLLTSDSFAVRYANLIARFSHMTPKAMLERWQRAIVPAAFFLEKRRGEAYSRSFPERDVFGLSTYRTEVAENAESAGVLRVGKGWRSDSRRQDLPDWHLDKLTQIDGRTLVLSAFENVHQRRYITEKVFDAFAVGAVPAYWAGPHHRIFEFVCKASMLNCHDLTPKEAANKITRFVPDAGFAEAWLDVAAKLAALFADATAIQAERHRVADALLRNIDALLYQPLVQESKVVRDLPHGIANGCKTAPGSKKKDSLKAFRTLAGEDMRNSDKLSLWFKERMDNRLARWYKGASPHTNLEKQERQKFLASLVNKSSMYAYVSRLGLRLPKQFAESVTPDGFAFSSLPSRVVIKPNNNADSKGVMLFENDRELLSGDAVSLDERAAYVARVCKRDRIFDKPGTRLIAEEFMPDHDPAFAVPRDFKVFVAGGRARLIQVIDRNPEKKLRTNSFFDRDWTFIEERIKKNYLMGPAYPRPPHLEALLADADRIARDIGVFYRLDFYLTATGPVFGEFTSYPSAGMAFTPFGDRLMCEMMDMDADPDMG